METILAESKKYAQRMEPHTNMKMIRLRALAQKLADTVIENDITMQEIVDEVNAVRKERYETQNCI